MCLVHTSTHVLKPFVLLHKLDKLFVAVDARVFWNHVELAISMLLHYVAQCCKSVQTIMRLTGPSLSHPYRLPPPSLPRTVVKQALSAGAVPVRNSVDQL